MEASFLYTTFAVGPMPPDTEKTSGEKHPRSTRGVSLCHSNRHSMLFHVVVSESD